MSPDVEAMLALLAGCHVEVCLVPALGYPVTVEVALIAPPP